MEEATIPTDIARSATACKEVFDMCAPTGHTWIRSAQVDFNLWCSAIKATSVDKSGMGQRLRNYPEARESICNLLHALKTSVEGAVAIYMGNAKELEDDNSEDLVDDIPELEEIDDGPAWEGELEDSDSAEECDEVQSSSTRSDSPADELIDPESHEDESRKDDSRKDDSREGQSNEDDALSNSGSTSTNDSALEEYISYVKTILDQLTRISLTIRRAGAKYRFERADKALEETEDVQAFRRHLTTIINSGFPDNGAQGLSAIEKMKRVYDDSKFSPVQQKLIRANVLRKHRIEYFTKARAPRNLAPVEGPKEVRMQKPDKAPAAVDQAPPTSMVSSKAKERESQPVTRIAPTVHEAPVEKTRSIYTAAVTATDVGPNFDAADLSAEKTPSRVSGITKIGGSQAYPGCPKPQPNGTLICPYCGDKLPESYAKNEQSWKAHVAQDILPYSCIMEECSNDNDMYLKADQLLAHMKAKHSTTKWTCTPCSTNTKLASESDKVGQPDPQVLVFFDSAESWLAHTEREHGSLGPAPQRDILVDLSKRQLIGPLECPLCKTEPTELRSGIDEHILKHLHEFALRALPGDAGSANEKESTAFQASSNISLLSYTKDSWTADVGTPEEEFINPHRAWDMLDRLESELEASGFTKRNRKDLRKCRDILELGFQHYNVDNIPETYNPPLLNLWQASYVFDTTVWGERKPRRRVTRAMEQDIFTAAMERVMVLDINEIKGFWFFLNHLQKAVEHLMDLPLPSPGPDRVEIEDITERIDTGLTKDTDLTRHSNKYKNSPMPLGEEFRKPTRDDVGLVRQLSLLPNIILTGPDPSKNTTATIALVNELKERVEDWSILWVDARSVASIENSCVQILETLIEVKEEGAYDIPRCGVNALMHYLSWMHEGLWIMVFDRLDAQGAIYLRMENMLPRSCAGAIIISTTDPTSAQLLGIAEVIQLPGTDSSFDRNRVKYVDLRAHLAAVLVSRPTAGPIDIDKDTRSFDYFAKLELDPIQERLVEANLRRRHRFMEAQQLSGGLKLPSTNASNTAIPQHPVPIETIHADQEARHMDDIASKLREYSPSIAFTTGHTTVVLTVPTVYLPSASGLDLERGGFPVPTTIRARPTIRYPRVHAPRSPGQNLVKCPCCCQALLATELDRSRWRKHLANDLRPYTCVVKNCPTPYDLFATQKEWKDHVTNDHPSQWQCPCCEVDPPIFESVPGIKSHLMSKHRTASSGNLDKLLADAAISVTRITTCPLCDTEGSQDSLDLTEHVLEHVHDFSLRSLPWPMDQPISLDKPVGTFDIVNEQNSHIAEWAESVATTLEKSRDEDINLYEVTGYEAEVRVMEVELSTLQLCSFDLNPPAASEEESTLRARTEEDYFSQNVYFVDESSAGQSSSERSLPSWPASLNYIPP